MFNRLMLLGVTVNGDSAVAHTLTMKEVSPMTTRQTIAQRVTVPVNLPPLPKSAGGAKLTWRPLHKRDARKLYRLYALAAPHDHPTDRIAMESVRFNLGLPHFTPETDGVIATAADGTVVAFGAAYAEDPPAEDAPSHAEPRIEISLDGVVHPDYRGRGIGRALLAWLEARGTQILAASESTLPAMLTLASLEAATHNTRLFEAAGYEQVRQWRSMRRIAGEPLPEREIPEGLRVMPFKRSLSEPTRVAFNDAFQDHWGFTPISAAEWRRHKSRSFSPKTSRYLVSGKGTAADPYVVAAFVLSEVDRKEWALNGYSFGYLEIVAVTRAWRGKGLSTTVMVEALKAYEEAGFNSAVLDVDVDNPSGASGMYERLGFIEQDRSVSYAKRF